MKLDFIAKKIEYAKMRRFIMDDANDFLYNNGVESIESMDFIDCVNLNIFSNDFRQNGKTDLAPIRETCYNEVKSGNPYKSAYRGLDPFNEYSILGKVINNTSGGNFEIIRTGMEKDEAGNVQIFVVWEGTYKGDSGEFGVTKTIRDFNSIPNSFDIGDILSRMGDL